MAGEALNSLKLRAPAKLNLFLHVTGVRPDGYHNLQSIFQLVDLCDELSLSRLTTGEIQLKAPIPGVPETENLCWRAAKLLQAHSGCPLGASIVLEKNIPLGGGLGGGSSDAAAVLLGLNQLWDLNVPLDTLTLIGQELGADVPFFVRGNTAWVEGIGEQVTPIERAQKYFVIVHPNVSISTRELFAEQGLTRDSPPIRMQHFLAGQTRNAFESVVVKRYPQVASALKWLSQFGEARMTGTGACVFLAVDTADKAQFIANKVPDDWAAWAVKGLNDSPVIQDLTAIIRPNI